MREGDKRKKVPLCVSTNNAVRNNELHTPYYVVIGAVVAIVDVTFEDVSRKNCVLAPARQGSQRVRRACTVHQ